MIAKLSSLEWGAELQNNTEVSKKLKFGSAMWFSSSQLFSSHIWRGARGVLGLFPFNNPNLSHVLFKEIGRRTSPFSLLPYPFAEDISLGLIINTPPVDAHFSEFDILCWWCICPANDKGGGRMMFKSSIKMEDSALCFQTMFSKECENPLALHFSIVRYCASNYAYPHLLYYVHTTFGNEQ
jgi:hypothetical protein